MKSSFPALNISHVFWEAVPSRNDSSLFSSDLQIAYRYYFFLHPSSRGGPGSSRNLLEHLDLAVSWNFHLPFEIMARRPGTSAKGLRTLTLTQRTVLRGRNGRARSWWWGTSHGPKATLLHPGPDWPSPEESLVHNEVGTQEILVELWKN